jgi:hypothetical protein
MASLGFPLASALGGEGLADIIPPVVDNFVPAPFSSIGGDAAVTFDVTDNSAVMPLIVVYVEYVDLNRSEVAYDGVAFPLPYNNNSTITPIVDGSQFLIRRNGGWVGDFRIRVSVTDRGGNLVVTSGVEYDIPIAGGSPVISNFIPAVGAEITTNTSIQFDVTDDQGSFRKIFIVADFPSISSTEVVHDGNSFKGFYVGTSTRISIPGGFRFKVLRAGGWPDSPTITTSAIDVEGNEGS